MTGTSLAATVSAGCRGGGRREAGWKWSPDSGLLGISSQVRQTWPEPGPALPKVHTPWGRQTGHRPRRAVAQAQTRKRSPC